MPKPKAKVVNQPSTWRAVAFLISTLGSVTGVFTVSDPVELAAILNSVAIAFSGLIGFFYPDKTDD